MIAINGYRTPYEKSICMQEVWPLIGITGREAFGKSLEERTYAVNAGLHSDLVKTADEILSWYLRGLGDLGSAW